MCVQSRFFFQLFLFVFLIEIRLFSLLLMFVHVFSSFFIVFELGGNLSCALVAASCGACAHCLVDCDSRLHWWLH